MKIEINTGFAEALNLLEKTQQNLFITGKAGTGKSTLLEYFRKNTQKRVAVLAPTGVAALNVEGQTIHSFFLIPPNITPNKVLEHELSEKRIRLIKKLDTLIIDEVSMLRADLLDCIDVSLRHHRDQSLPFGGIQMVFIGDLYQLPPVVAGAEEKQLFSSHYFSPYFFSAKSLEDIELKQLELKKIYRQKDSSFIELLNKIRNKTVSEDDLKILNARHLPHFEENQNKNLIITLNTTNASADQKNMEELQKLSKSEETFYGEIEGKFKKNNLPTHEELKLKIGAQIMMLNNDMMGRWINGSLGKIKDIVFDDKSGDDALIVELNTGKNVKVKKHSWRIHKYFFNKETSSIDTEVVGSFTQFPVRLAWAVTIHKSQGKTFDNVIIDIGWGTFAHGQLYVALSRCTSLGGIILKKPIQKRHIIMDQRIHKFIEQSEFLPYPSHDDYQHYSNTNMSPSYPQQNPQR
ncbi:AAA family ATPase [Candidatus Peregrinibacteria bacterium]|nr:AAA family ATPase [Candidatus Peregrinibacteria bacterium]